MNNPFWEGQPEMLNLVLELGPIVARKRLHGHKEYGYVWTFDDLTAKFVRFTNDGIEFEITESAEGHFLKVHEVDFEDIPDNPLEIRKLKFWYPEDLQ